MIIAFIGDVVGKSGRRAVTLAVPRIRAEHGAEFVIANAENSAGGFGINPGAIDEMAAAGVDFFTTGNHVWDKREGLALLDTRKDIVRPGNYPAPAPGRGSALVPASEGRVAVVNVQGRVFMPALDCPFRTVDRLLAELPESVRIRIVDVHAEATSEKIAMAYHLDGRVSLVLGTHTHVATRDARVLTGGTGAVTDVGMTGSFDSILGVRKDEVIARFLTMRPTRFEVARADVRCDFVVAEIDDDSGRARDLVHHQLVLED
ncbi:MAG TPA: TIGR00282 family metallophosphoesterase [Candidatus Krumholzibacteria bacterium]|nr:TIGR00282 family metallophosphoesterase [Candidatus Krumholzibacteria bacterium]